MDMWRVMREGVDCKIAYCPTHPISAPATKSYVIGKTDRGSTSTSEQKKQNIPALASVLPSGLTAIHVTASVCPKNNLIQAPL